MRTFFHRNSDRILNIRYIQTRERRFSDSMMKHATLNKAILGMFLFLLVSSLVNVHATTTTDDETTEDETTSTDDVSETSTSGEDSDHSNDREVSVTVTSTHAEIESKLESGGTEDSFKIEIDLDGSVEFKIQFEAETTANETETEFKVGFDQLIEYIDVNSNGVYEDEVDTEVQTLALSSFEPLAYSTENISGIPVHIFDVLTTDGVFGARIYATGDFTNINGSVIAPTQVKIDVMIRNFNFTESTSQLALKVQLETSLETSYDDQTEDEDNGRAVDEAAIDILMTDISGFFSWKESAEIDGVTHLVNSSIHEVTATEQEIYLNYPQGSEIIHDPKLGFENLLIVNGNLLPIVQVLADNILPISIGIAIVIIGVIAVSRRR